MRPFLKGKSPRENDFERYEDAKEDLIIRIGLGKCGSVSLSHYCSYCERRIPTNLSVEHIQPKGGKYGRPDLMNKWDNFLLACVNCNSTKKDRSVFFDYFFFPDRDNTFDVFVYKSDGTIHVNENKRLVIQIIANNTLWLTGLNIELENNNSEDVSVAMCRVKQRKEVWEMAEIALGDYLQLRNSERIKNTIVRNMLSVGYFSVWMTVFADYPEMKRMFVESISGTVESKCFNGRGDAVYRHANLNKLKNTRLKRDEDCV
jgi:uncharacterized protein (TIGR02646 family)